MNGVKKWITNGMFADYFVCAVRTGKYDASTPESKKATKKFKGMGGITMLLIEKGEGVEVTGIKTSYSKAAGTALVMFDDCKVPVENTFGEEHKGFKCIMANFNHERWYICAYVQGALNELIRQSFLWIKQRKIFGGIL